MKLPQKPPDFHKSLITKGLSKFSARHIQAADDRYRHWDELRHRKPPEGLTHEQWWLVTKIKRLSALRRTELLDTEGNPFQFATPDFLAIDLHQIDLSMGGNVGVPEPITNPNTRDRYLVRSLIEEAITSSQLEGAATTREVAKEMIRTGRNPRDLSERMILNNFVTMQRIRELKAEALTPEIVFEIHHIVTQGTLEIEDGAGRFRNRDEKRIVGDLEGAVFHTPPDPEELQERLEKMCAFANGAEEPFIHPVIRSVILHFWLAYDHPFVDGNGRTARALFYWSMLHHNYWLFEFVSISSVIKKAPVKYGRSFLHTETDDNDLTYFISAQVKVIRQAIEGLHQYIDRKSTELQSMQRRLKALDFFNPRQAGLLLHALETPGTRYTIASHRASHAVSYQTARSDLMTLQERSLMFVERVGKKNIFYAKTDLVTRLEKLQTKNEEPDTR